MTLTVIGIYPGVSAATCSRGFFVDEGFQWRTGYCYAISFRVNSFCP
jgi:hypothetical protein